MDRFGSRVAFEKGGSVIMPIYCADDLKKGYIFSKQKHERLFQRVAEARMDKEWLDRVRNIWWGKTADEILKDNPGLKQLVAIRERLLEFGGDDDHAPDDEAALEMARHAYGLYCSVEVTSDGFKMDGCTQGECIDQAVIDYCRAHDIDSWKV
jgi:hypothetical protein